MIGLSPNRPGYFHAQPEVEVAALRVPPLSCAKNTVVSRTRSGSVALFDSPASGIFGQSRRCSALIACSSFSHQTRLESAIRLSPASAPISAAKRAAPAPTRISWLRSSITRYATSTGCRYPCNAPTAPVRKLSPSITEASSSISPNTLGQPP
ncbi:hypothetical protein D3C81_1523320 [compost metagenome]